MFGMFGRISSYDDLLSLIYRIKVSLFSAGENRNLST